MLHPPKVSVEEAKQILNLPLGLAPSSLMEDRLHRFKRRLPSLQLTLLTIIEGSLPEYTSCATTSFGKMVGGQQVFSRKAKLVKVVRNGRSSSTLSGVTLGNGGS